ncbi:MAG: hypothetical protein B6241_05805 [Spirochaetaceae bacterium 4572_59]|nr:MAG: hypothetical protein B6241_05805 [Spirochaetaceae bacterium 4572_59]
MKVLWTEHSIQDLEGIHDYISKDSVFFADRQIDKILSCESEISEFPKSGRTVPEYRDVMIREIIIENYRVIYRIEHEQISVLTILHGARLLKGLSDTQSM